ncbi:MAG: hypothetical protein KC503_29505 [Myxococcales bacterium]|nr:hypothetical protein [Myxococcales bacterium]
MIAADDCSAAKAIAAPPLALLTLVLAAVAVTPSQLRAAPRDPAAPAVLPRSRGSKWWLARHRELLGRVAAVRKKKAAQPAVVFIGDSITSGWDNTGSGVFARFYAKRHGINLGVEGDRTEHVLWRIAHGTLDGLTPRVVVLLIGTNNDATHGSADIGRGIVAVVRAIEHKLPRTKVLLLAIFPRDRRPNPRRVKLAHASRVAARALRRDARVRFLDIKHAFVGRDGVLSRHVMSDFLHLTGAGYRRWAEAIEPALKKMLAAR